jgi:hypothetical protein
VLYLKDERPTQEAQLTMFNAEDGNVRAPLRQLTIVTAYPRRASDDLRCNTSANSVNVGWLLPQMVYYFMRLPRWRCGTDAAAGRCHRLHAVGQLRNLIGLRQAYLPIARSWRRPTLTTSSRSTPTGLFRRAVRANDRQRDGRRPSEQLRADAVAHGNAADAMRHDIAGVRYADDDARNHRGSTRHGYLLDPHWRLIHGLAGQAGLAGRQGRRRTLASPSGKFSEIVEPIIGRRIHPAPLAEALARPRHMLRMDARSAGEALRLNKPGLSGTVTAPTS